MPSSCSHPAGKRNRGADDDVLPRKRTTTHATPRFCRPRRLTRLKVDLTNIPAEEELEPETWVEAFDRNIKESPIYRIPTELILEIASHLPEENQCVLQQTSRRFRGVYTGQGFSRKPVYPFTVGCLTYDAAINSYLTYDAARMENRRLIQRDMFCSSCLDNKAAKASWFIPTVRGYQEEKLEEMLYCGGCNTEHPTGLFSVRQRTKGRSRRICIGREGYVRLCPHKTVSWSDVEKYVERCTDGAGRGEEIAIIECRHKSHLFSRQGSGRPRLELRYDRMVKEVELELRWSIKPLDIEPGAPVTFRHLQNKLSSEGLEATTSFCPHYSLEDLASMLEPFQPHRCACTRTHSALPQLHEEMSSCESLEDADCCVCYSNNNGGATSGKLLAFPVGPFSSAPSHKVECSACPTTYEWEAAGNAVKLSRIVDGAYMSSASSRDWVLMLDPDSFDLKEPRLLHKVWCDSPDCVTYRNWKKQIMLKNVTQVGRKNWQWGEPVAGREQ